MNFKKWLFTAVMIFLMAIPVLSMAEQADDITKTCKFKASGNGHHVKRMFDDLYDTYWMANTTKKGYLEITAPKGEKLGGVYIKWYNNAPAWRLTVEENGEWQTVAQSEDGFLADYLALPEAVSKCRVYTGEKSRSKMTIVELRAYGEGEPPADVQQWSPTAEKSDLLVISAHPDDEVLFMGGTIPYYAGEMKKTVEVLYLVPSTYYRKLELLDGLWLCGVRNYPILGKMRDNYAMSLKVMYQKWNKEQVYRLITSAIRRCKPDVVVTHDIKGEYGHGAHRAAADAAIHCFKETGKAKKYSESAEKYGTWNASKLYIHLYPKNPITMDWRQPLEAFGGKTAFDMATAAFHMHRSQQRTDYVVADDGPYDNRQFGLYYSTVGDDIEKNDFFENIE
ncbi:MAG: PIG-L deacetylase family protein [Clostridia bacterium]